LRRLIRDETPPTFLHEIPTKFALGPKMLGGSQEEEKVVLDGITYKKMPEIKTRSKQMDAEKVDQVDDHLRDQQASIDMEKAILAEEQERQAIQKAELAEQEQVFLEKADRIAADQDRLQKFEEKRLKQEEEQLIIMEKAEMERFQREHEEQLGNARDQRENSVSQAQSPTSNISLNESSPNFDQENVVVEKITTIEISQQELELAEQIWPGTMQASDKGQVKVDVVDVLTEETVVEQTVEIPGQTVYVDQSVSEQIEEEMAMLQELEKNRKDAEKFEQDRLALENDDHVDANNATSKTAEFNSSSESPMSPDVAQGQELNRMNADSILADTPKNKDDELFIVVDTPSTPKAVKITVDDQIKDSKIHVGKDNSVFKDTRLANESESEKVLTESPALPPKDEEANPARHRSTASADLQKSLPEINVGFLKPEEEFNLAALEATKRLEAKDQGLETNELVKDLGLINVGGAQTDNQEIKPEPVAKETVMVWNRTASMVPKEEKAAVVEERKKEAGCCHSRCSVL
jgi:hypothetical protein